MKRTFNVIQSVDVN